MSKTEIPVQLFEGDVKELLDPLRSMRAVERGLLAEAENKAETLPKSVLGVGDARGDLHILGAVAPGLGVAGIKSWLQAGGVAHPVLLLFSSETARHIATIEAAELSNLRTGALAGIATKQLASQGQAELALIGSGKIAASLFRAVAAVRKLKSVRIWSPTFANRQTLADSISVATGTPALASESAKEALDGATIVGLAARVKVPAITSDMIAPGAHVNAIGLTISGRSELPQDAFARSSMVCTDSLPSVRNLSDDFRSFYSSSEDWSNVWPLSRILAEQIVRQNSWDLTLYKGMGTGVADLALGAELLLQAHARGDRIELPEALESYVDVYGPRPIATGWLD